MGERHGLGRVDGGSLHSPEAILTLALVVPGPLDRRSGGYSYDVDLVAHLESLGHTVEVWGLPPGTGAAKVELARRLDQSAAGAVIFDALVHPPVTSLLERLKTRSNAAWIGLVHHLAWLDDPKTGLATRGKKALEKRFLETMDAYVFNSSDTRRTVAELRGPQAEFRPSVLCRPPCTVPRDKVAVTGAGRFLFLGNLLPRKNLHGLLAALSLLAARRPELNWTLTVAGSPLLDKGYAAKCRRQVEASGLRERVVWAGWVGEQEREALWACSDLLALPSFHEGWGMAHAEALSRGLPSLAVPRGGVLEVLGDAALWSPDDAASLSAALERYLDDAAFRGDLARKARHRGEVLRTETGFGDLGGFLESLTEGPRAAPAFDFGAYLESKASVDSRSLHPRILEAAFSETPRRVLELGGGTGTMARRLRRLDRVGPATDYLLVDQGAEGLELAREKTSPLFLPGAFTTRQADLLDFWESPPPAPDLVIAHALLDLFDPRAAAPALARLGATRYWLTHLFDGLTSWDPVVDPVLDEALTSAYHRSMDERAPGGAQGAPRSGRDWLTALPRAGFRILDAASADWVVRAENGRYPADEAVFLKSLLHFFRSSLSGRSDVDQGGLNWWLRVREAQVDRGEAVFLAHQLDLVAELVR